jgi:hypothetical protein
MSDPDHRAIPLGRTALSVAPLFDSSDERSFWISRTPAERLRYLEVLRRINYGPRAFGRLERVLEVVPLGWVTTAAEDDSRKRG